MKWSKHFLVSIIVILLSSSQLVKAQQPNIIFGKPTQKSADKPEEDEDEKSNPFWNKVFIGGGLNIGWFGNPSTLTLGLLPEIGYSFNDYFDLGLIFNINYIARSGDNTATYYVPKTTIWNFGAGTFLRFHPTQDFFLQVQPEFNNYSVKAEYPNGTVKDNFGSTSFLAGIGYGRRVVGDMSYYTSIMIDLSKEPYSPYRDSYGNVIPVVRSGITWYFGNKRRR